MGYPYRSIKTN